MSGSQDYTVGWICALRVEFEAALSFLDERHEMPQWVAQRDNNTYALGRIGRHNVVIATPPYGEYGLASAATVARDMLSSFPNLRIVLSVGIGGGAPSPKHDIRLGDVVVSEPGDGHGGVLQYDFDKSIQSGSFHMTGFLNWPPILLRSALVRLRVMHEMEGHQLVAAVNAKLKIIKKPKKYVRPSPASDRLYKSHVVHPLTSSDGGDVCGDDAAHLVARHERGEEDDDPEIHYGFIASANQLMKDARMRDELAAERDVLCFETEAAGLMNFIPSLVIRGICDYSDSHKTNTWQGFAAMTAAAYATDLLSKIPPNTVKAERRMIDILDQVHGQLHQIPQEVNETKGSISAIGNGQHLEKLRHWLSPPDLVSHSSNIAREHQHPGVRTWFLEGSAFHEWKTGKRKHLWLYAPPGHGKTVLSTTILDHLRESNANPALAFFFHTHDTRRQTLEDLVRSLAFQLYHTGGEVAGKLNNLFTAHDDGQRDPSISDLSTCVESMLRISRRVTVILDALDECTMRADLLRWMKRLASSSNIGDTKFIVTSRPEAEFLHDIPQIFGEDNCIPFDASVFNHNIRSFATEELYKNPEFVDKIPPHLLEEIRNRIGDEANGMCVTCQLYGLPKCPHPQPRRTVLEHVLAALDDETYEYILRENQFNLVPTDALTISDESHTTLGVASQTFSGGLISTKQSSPDEDINAVDEGNVARQMAKTFYSHTKVESYSDDIDDEIRSLISGPEDIQSQDGSNFTRREVIEAAASYLAEMLTRDSKLGPLYAEASKRLDDARFSRNHGRLLRRYYLSLRSQAPTRKQGVAIDFLRPRAHRSLISRKIVESTRKEKVHVTLPQADERNLTLERFLNSIEDKSAIAEVETPLDIDEWSEHESSVDGDEDGHNGLALADLDNARGYFVSGTPLMHFEAEFRDFLHLSRKGVEETHEDIRDQQQETKPGVNTKPHAWHCGVTYWTGKLFAWLYDMRYPPKPGYQRIRYICECDDHMFLDVKELSPGGIQRFRQPFAKDGLARLITPHDSTTDQDSTAEQDHRSGLSPPPLAHFRSERTQSPSSRQDFEQGTFLSGPGPSMPASETSRSEEDSLHPGGQNTPQYLLMCVNQKSLPVLDHIDCGSFRNDQYLFQQILERYQTIREGSTWRISLLFPSLVCEMLGKVLAVLKQNTPSWLEWTFQFFQKLSEASLFKMHTGDYVRFRLVPMGESTNPQHFQCGEYPPVFEVLEAKTYLYDPVPTDVAVDSIPLWHLTIPGLRHSDNYWVTTFPKKLRSPLHRQPGTREQVIGWGIRINERFNWGLFFSLLLVTLLIIWAIVAIYLSYKADDSSGFGLGALLAALVAIYMPFQYFAWKEKLE